MSLRFVSMSLRFVATLALTLSLTTVTAKFSSACPFCSAVGQTIRQEMSIMDAVVIASSLPNQAGFDPNTGEVRMRIEEILKGGDLVQVGQEVDVILYGEVEKGQKFMLSGVDPPDMQWSCLPLSERAEAYVRKIPTLPEDEGQRLKFYYDYLQDDETMLSRDAYDEFAISSYSAFKEMESIIEHDKLMEWLAVPDMSADRKRLYLTMLGVVGDENDLPFLEAMMRSSQKSSRSGLDALIGCYLTLSGEKGLQLVNELFLDNKKASYADTYAAIMAIRFHGTEGDTIARSALVESLHIVLDREDLADLVIPDLARWSDWSQVDKMKELFLEADADNNWVRVPVVNYLRACPLPEADKALKELQKVDPESIQRAGTFFSIPVPAQDTGSDEASILRQSDRRVAASLRDAGDYESRRDSATKKVAASLRDAGCYESRRDSATEKVAASRRDAKSSGAFAAVLRAKSLVAPHTSNPWHLLYVVSLALSSVMIGQYLILSGGAL